MLQVDAWFEIDAVEYMRKTIDIPVLLQNCPVPIVPIVPSGE